jgi:predicted metal-binding protein
MVMCCVLKKCQLCQHCQGVQCFHKNIERIVLSCVLRSLMHIYTHHVNQLVSSVSFNIHGHPPHLTPVMTLWKPLFPLSLDVN